MPLTTQSKAFLDELKSKGSKPTYQLTPAEARMNRDVPLEPGPEVYRVEERIVRYDGGEVPVRIYRPDDEPVHPVLIWFHGGGWVLGSLTLADGTCRRLVAGARCAVVSVDYRLAPEWKFPTAVHDCFAVAAWASANAAALGFDAERFAVGGDSAGGNLAAVVSILARDAGAPAIAFQLLVYPAVDHNFDRPGYAERGQGTRLTREHLQWFWGHYLRSPSDGASPMASPIRVATLRGLPPALVLTAEFDPLCDEGEAYARRLAEAGVPTEQKTYLGVPHLFFMVPGRIDEGRLAIAQACEALQRALKIKGDKK